MAYYDKTFRVNAVCKTFNLGNFAIGNNGHDHFSFVMFITGFGMKKGYAAVDLGENCIGDFMCFSCNNFDFCSGF